MVKKFHFNVWKNTPSKILDFFVPQWGDFTINRWNIDMPVASILFFWKYEQTMKVAQLSFDGKYLVIQFYKL